MSLNSIRLTQHQVADLYPESLVLTTDIASTKSMAEDIPVIEEKSGGWEKGPIQPELSIQFLGKNNRNLVILVFYPDTVHIAEASLEFLSSVLKACQLTLADVAIVNMARQNPGLEQLQNELAPLQMLCFGLPHPVSGLPAGLPVLAPQSIQDIKLMIAPSLEELNQQTEAVKPLKRLLWEGLKTMLGI
ncbi:hypothetical protein GCM10027036_15790 [Flavihumibacter cheonanensis]|uniref:hypothetical protein n=1 Tax=Flavihumibacter cheonanensis TaxID=1442385 RepID=UPI001EF83410|nr:hypothetical protein [Flavihumibacter cheonanensis]MCG7750981.1 hypothetical protein [Flavihumibacter cheonanensis]